MDCVGGLPDDPVDRKREGERRSPLAQGLGYRSTPPASTEGDGSHPASIPGLEPACLVDPEPRIPTKVRRLALER